MNADKDKQASMEMDLFREQGPDGRLSPTERLRKEATAGINEIWRVMREMQPTARRADAYVVVDYYVAAVNKVTNAYIQKLKNKNVSPFTLQWKDVLREEYQNPYGKGLFVDEAALAQFEQCVSSHYEGDHMRAARQLINDTMRLKGGPQDINKWLMKWCGNHERSGGNIL